MSSRVVTEATSGGAGSICLLLWWFLTGHLAITISWPIIYLCGCLSTPYCLGLWDYLNVKSHPLFLYDTHPLQSIQTASFCPQYIQMHRSLSHTIISSEKRINPFRPVQHLEEKKHSCFCGSETTILISNSPPHHLHYNQKGEIRGCGREEGAGHQLKSLQYSLVASECSELWFALYGIQSHCTG